LKDVFLAKELELTAAARKSKYSARGLGDADPTDADTTVTEFKTNPGSPTNVFFGLKWKPFNDLLVRASVGDTFRAPSAGDLFGGTGEGFPQAQDRCKTTNTASNPGYAALNAAQKAACDAVTGLTGVGAPQPFAQIRSLFGSSPFLQPEKGKNQNVGIVYSPSYAEGFEISLDYWKIELEDAISTFSPGFIINQCHRSLDAGFCQFIVRDKFNAVTNPLGTGAITVVNAIPFNAAGYNLSGIDATVTYRFDAGSWGNFRIQLDTTKVIKNETQTLPTSAPFDVTGLYTGNPNPEYRSNLFVDWTKGDWSVNWTTRTMSDVYETCFFYCNDQGEGNGENHTGFYAVHDINVRWKAPWDAVISVGKRNAFDKDPPVLTNNTFAHSFDAAYDIPGGGFWYAQYRQDF
jgi:outer membrane receptor protein involved in Fe transport